MRITVFLTAVLLLLPACRNKTMVDTRELASTVTDKAFTIIHPGHYTGSYLYCGLADLEDPRLLPILQDLADGKTKVGWASVHCYHVGGPAAAYLAWKGNEKLLETVKENAAYMWENQYRTTDSLMTGNIQQERFRDGVWIDLVFSITPYMLYAGLLEWAPETEIFGAAFADPNQVEGIVRSGKDVLLLVRVPSGSEVTVYTGALWDQQFVECSHLAWEGYAKDLFAQTDWNKLNERYQ